MINNNRVVTYSFLAYINNNNAKISDFRQIFIPIVKQSLFKMHSNGIKKGILKDIKESVFKLFGLDMPYPILRKITEIISKDFNDKNSKEFVLYDDGAFPAVVGVLFTNDS